VKILESNFRSASLAVGREVEEWESTGFWLLAPDC
jgi:hypothetical protein